MLCKKRALQLHHTSSYRTDTQSTITRFWKQPFAISIAVGRALKLADIRQLPVTHCAPYQASGCSFALPIFSHPDDPALRIIQDVDQYTGKLASFAILENLSSLEVMPVAGATAQIGEDLIFAFVDEKRIPFAGTLKSLSGNLRAYLKRCPDDISTGLQIIELVGSAAEKKRARSDMRSLISSVSGEKVGTAFYRGSVLRSALWERLVALLPDSDSVFRALRIRSKLDVVVGASGRVSLKIDALEERDRRFVDESTLARAIEEDFELSALSPEHLFPAALKPSNLMQQERVAVSLNRIRRARRQEERLALLLATILEDRDTGLSLLRQYRHDRAQATDKALVELRDAMLTTAGDGQADELIVAKLIPRFFTVQYPLSRGKLLAHLARHLARWPHVNDAIAASTRRTRSVFVDNFRQEIEHLLSEGRVDAQKRVSGEQR